MRGQTNLRSLVRRGVGPANQLTRNSNSVSALSILPAGHTGTPCASTLRQQVRGAIHNHQGGLVSKRLANDLLVCAQTNLRTLKVTHVLGKMNQGADMLSRSNVSSEEWTLHPLAVQKIWEVFGRARVDLFASEDNSHCPIFFTKTTDALGHEWPSLRLYAYLPVAQTSQGTMAQAYSNSPPLEEPTMGVGVILAAESCQNSTQYELNIERVRTWLLS